MPVAERCAQSVRQRRVRCHIVFTRWRLVVHLTSCAFQRLVANISPREERPYAVCQPPTIPSARGWSNSRLPSLAGDGSGGGHRGQPPDAVDPRRRARRRTDAGEPGPSTTTSAPCAGCAATATPTRSHCPRATACSTSPVAPGRCCPSCLLYT